MTKVMTKKNVGAFAVVMLMAAIITVVPEAAHAQARLNNLLSDGTFLPILKFGLGLYAAWKWFQYFANFNPNSAFTDIIVPALITFLAFQIQTVLGWFGLNRL